jgi:predicted DNA-binding transcriptional regulator AlpA
MVRLLESGEAARIGGCSRDTVLNEVAAGRLPVAYTTGHGRHLFTDEAVQEWRRARERERRERLERRAAAHRG